MDRDSYTGDNNMKRILHILNVSLVLCMAMLVSCGGDKGAKKAADGISTVANQTMSSSEDAGKSAVVTESDVKGPAIIDFWAEWCGPCQMMKPVFAKLEKEYAGSVNFISVDVDNNQELSAKYGVQAIPTFVVIDKDGLEIDRLVGAVPEEKLRSLIEKIN